MIVMLTGSGGGPIALEVDNVLFYESASKGFTSVRLIGDTEITLKGDLVDIVATINLERDPNIAS